MSRSICLLSNGRRLAAVAVAALALTSAACSDEATAPAPAPVARSIDASNAITVGADVPQVATFISVRIIGVDFKNVTEKATVKFKWVQPYDSVLVTDNSAKDLDPTIGVVKIAAATAKGYLACVTGETAHFAADPAGASYPVCNSKSWLSFNIALGDVFMRRKPQLAVSMKDVWSKLLPGATLRVTGGGWQVDVADGSAMDEAVGNNGIIMVTVPRAGSYVWAAVKNPTGKYELIDSSYIGTLGWETKTNANLYFAAVAY